MDPGRLLHLQTQVEQGRVDLPLLSLSQALEEIFSLQLQLELKEAQLKQLQGQRSLQQLKAEQQLRDAQRAQAALRAEMSELYADFELLRSRVEQDKPLYHLLKAALRFLEEPTSRDLNITPIRALFQSEREEIGFCTICRRPVRPDQEEVDEPGFYGHLQCLEQSLFAADSTLSQRRWSGEWKCVCGASMLLRDVSLELFTEADYLWQLNHTGPEHGLESFRESTPEEQWETSITHFPTIS